MGCETLSVRDIELAVGEQARRQAGIAIITSLVFAGMFTAFTWLCKEVPSLNVRQPWQDDPYDVLVSLDFVILPLLVGLAALRVPLCRQCAKLPARRVTDLLRISTAILAVCLATEMAEWIAVTLRLHSAGWNAATTWQEAALAVETAATIGAYLLLSRATHAVRRTSRPSAQPDWLADAVNLGIRVSRGLGRHAAWGENAVRWIDEQAFARIRRHPVVVAALLAAVCGLPYVAAKIVLEGYPPALVLLSFALPTAALFAVIVIVGRYLRVVAPQPGGTPAWLAAAVAACLGGTLTFAFHDSLLAHQTAAGLNALLFGGALAAGVLYAAVNATMRHYTGSRTTPAPPR
jgi:hypothetical protein